MSNHYISNCCGAQVTELDTDANIGRCSFCKEMAELEVVIDE